MESKASLFERIGGHATVDAAVDLFYLKVVCDKRVECFFSKVDMTKQRQMQKQFLTYAFGGNTKWNEKSIRHAHRNMNLKERHYHAIVQDLTETLRELSIADNLICEVLEVVGHSKNDVLGIVKDEGCGKDKE